MNSQREKARRIAWVVWERIGQVTTEGLGRWPPSFVMVSEQMDAFIDTLYVWENSGLLEDLRAVEQAGVDLVSAWRVADTQFQISRLADAPEAVSQLEGPA